MELMFSWSALNIEEADHFALADLRIRCGRG